MLDRPVGGVDQSHQLQQLVGPRGGLTAAEAVEPCEHHQVLMATEDLVDRRLLAAEPDPAAHLVGSPGHVGTGHTGHPGVSTQQRGQDANHGGLAGAIGPQQPADGSGGNGQVDSIKRDRLSESFGQPVCLDRQCGVLHLVPPFSVRFTELADTYNTVRRKE